MPPVVSFVAASSNSGKTTLIEKIVPILKVRGLRVAVIKHASKGFDVDQPGKDSWRFQEAGADAVVLVGPEQLAVMRRLTGPPAPGEVELLAGNVDIIIKEGFKQDEINRIEVFRAGVSAERPLSLDDPSFLALVSDKPFSVPIPRFDLDDAEGVAEFIVRLHGL
ncbi:MAG: molybdopterin-guanine dinucleotide biosynthesis protein B [Nitrospirae bacterium GWC2_57_13]|jgi:molybdopterin-guanine dinucleotide biosynthesis protein MobB|nr:MAG: molybdopterin-guanine dinucleotide biosynthesis protein B [Nitrospirae bacterium GWC1_57_7]OGW27958.1 MAG: molybdopterin-guanine dinucleotide biosynthesis protein B [Nitrospirae bacterium GWC2_57_13]OGW45655.1 MAG: molybdopterin-guanine dinucleotide biosynthesis protein B [Nitrospirae bacterium GWD2_57_8]HAR46357.1 molybdopterin-guanine dinucleotide biosynthesis protein B [Nitrospiraceae bacterium]HAS55315.1 molybdopterin-guanine dinucleotide biosynthesis protein B [Nitrospiraceae bacte